MHVFPQCFECKNLLEHRADVIGPVCKAFPNGIPQKILFNLHDHKKPYPGDGGIRFEPMENNESTKGMP